MSFLWPLLSRLNADEAERTWRHGRCTKNQQPGDKKLEAARCRRRCARADSLLCLRLLSHIVVSLPELKKNNSSAVPCCCEELRWLPSSSMFAPSVSLRAANSASPPEALNGSIGGRRGGRKRSGICGAAFWLLAAGCSSQGQTARTRPQLDPSPSGQSRAKTEMVKWKSLDRLPRVHFSQRLSIHPSIHPLMNTLSYSLCTRECTLCVCARFHSHLGAI